MDTVQWWPKERSDHMSGPEKERVSEKGQVVPKDNRCVCTEERKAARSPASSSVPCLMLALQIFLKR